MSLPAGFEETAWDDLDFLGWVAQGAQDRAYLVSPADDGPVGVALRAAAGRSGRLRSAIWQFCVTGSEVQRNRIRR